MVVLSRKEGEAIILKLPNRQHVKVVLTEYLGQQTKVGIDAPDDV